MRQKMICGEFTSCLNYFVPTRDGILEMHVLSAVPEKIHFPVVGTFFFFLQVSHHVGVYCGKKAPRF